MNEVTTIIGVDLAKNVFQLHGAAVNGWVVFRKKLSRPQFQRFMAEHPDCSLRWRLVAARIIGRARWTASKVIYRVAVRQTIHQAAEG